MFHLHGPALRGGALALLAAVLFGVSTPLVQHLGAGLGAFSTAALLYAGAAGMGAVLRKPVQQEARLRRADTSRLLAMAGLGAVVGPVALAWGLQRTSGSSASLMLTLEALFTALLAWRLYHETMDRRVWAAMLLLSRAYLYMEDNQNALITAEAAIAGAEKNKYRLWTNDEYGTIWGTDFASSDPGEVLFELVNLTVDGVGKESVAYLCWQAGYDDYCLTSSFYELMQEDPDDVRNQAYTVVPKTKRAYIAKYQPQSGKAVEDSNIPVLRLSELYLIAAEAAVKLNNNDKAVKYLDAIVSRANPEKTVQGKTVTLDDVLLERRKELFGEGHRFFDALRNHQTIVRKESTKEFPEIAETSHLKMVDESVSFDWNYYRVVLPIPKAEMNSNPNMQQNPTYGD